MVIGVLPGHKGRIGHHDHTHFIGQTRSLRLGCSRPSRLTSITTNGPRTSKPAVTVAAWKPRVYRIGGTPPSGQRGWLTGRPSASLQGTGVLSLRAVRPVRCWPWDVADTGPPPIDGDPLGPRTRWAAEETRGGRACDRNTWSYRPPRRRHPRPTRTSGPTQARPPRPPRRPVSTTPASESGPRARPPSRQPTGSARRAHGRVADLHAALALSHDDHAKALRLRRTGAGA
ncbi:MAG: hypothetical protein QOD73_2473 [Solirubrobacteraceae bacterium]|nr:hypothetical protein [Solirubrobacteraceae bacterium]